MSQEDYMKKRVTIYQVARESGYSLATVSRVINNNGRFSEETRKKVQKIIDDYGYTTNMAAKSLRMSKSKTIGIIVPNISNEWFSKLVLEIEKYFFQKNYSVFICNTSQNEDKEIAYFKSLDSKLVDGIMCISGREEIPVNVMTRNIPIVCIDRKPKNHSNVYYVESNHYSGGYLATEELIKKGCRRIVIITRNKSLSVNNQRLDGYKQALRDYGLHEYPELQIFLDDKLSNNLAAREAVNKLIQSNIPFDGIFATNDWRAYGALVGVLENNLKVPEDVKIIGFDDIPISSSCKPELSTIKQDVKGLSQKASSLLLSLMNDQEVDTQERRLILPVQLIQRESTEIK